MIVAIVQVHLSPEGVPHRKEMHRFSSAEELLEAWEQLKSTHSWLYTVDCSKQTPPPVKFETEVPDGTCWCPYCADHRHFVYSSVLEQDQCNVCGITDRDYYVRKYNPVYHTKYLVTRKGDDPKRNRITTALEESNE